MYEFVTLVICYMFVKYDVLASTHELNKRNLSFEEKKRLYLLS